MLSENELKHLYELARIRMPSDQKTKDKILSDLSGIIDYFNKLNEVDTSKTEPLAGGTFLQNIFRNDGEKTTDDKMRKEQRESGVAQFSKKENNYLKIPPVFGKI